MRHIAVKMLSDAIERLFGALVVIGAAIFVGATVVGFVRLFFA